jgi:HEAT repeat protein
MKHLGLPAAVLLALVPAIFAEDESGSVDSLIEKLRSRSMLDRREAAEALGRIGDPAVPKLIPLLDDQDGRVQRAAMTALGLIATESSVRPLLKYLEAQDSEERDLAMKILQEVALTKPAALQAVAKTSPALGKKIEHLMDMALVRDIEAVFKKQTTPDGNTGFFTGQYAELKRLGPGGVRVLARMFAEPGFEWSDDEGVNPGKFRMMAGDALGEVGDQSLHSMLRDMAASGDLRETAAAALHKLGDPGPAAEIEKEYRDQLDGANGARGMEYFALVKLSQHYAKTDQNEKALEAYDELIKIQPAATNHYNRACCLARLKRTKEGVEEFRKAVSMGFESGEWAAFDKDLDNLRSDPEFQKIMTDELGMPAAESPTQPPAPSGPGGGGGATD